MGKEENIRFDWDILLEKDPENPPVQKEPPVEENKNAGTTAQENNNIEIRKVEEPPQKKKERKQEKAAEKPHDKHDKAVLAEANKKCKTKSLSGRRQLPDVLKGRLTPNALINGFVISELLGPPGGLRRKRRINRYL